MPPVPPSRPRRARHRLTLALTAAVALAGAVVLLGPNAVSAQTPTQAPASDRSHDPIGGVATVSMVPGGVRMVGWAADPDSMQSNLSYVTLLDGTKITDGPVTPYTYPSARAKYHTGPTPGFRIITKVPSGNHTFCLAARNIGAGIAKILRCVALPLGRTMSTTERATHNPVGQYTSAWAGNQQFRASGWSDDPDFVSRYSVVVLYIDGRAAATSYTHVNPNARSGGPGYRSAYDITVPVSRGTHVGCMWGVNAGIGTNSFLGCRTRDTRGAAGTGTVHPSTLNQQVVAEAIKHRGQPYVWGATGPSRFDCSGLVLYSYAKFGYTTPRIAADQRVAARLIPASRAVPGDLVFYHDNLGDVYHVGIYVSPGKTVAAIDTQEGVNWQYVWDPSKTTYGSFTHT